MPAVFEFGHAVHPDEIDELGHVSNLAYLQWMQSAAMAHSAAQGWDGERYRTLQAGWVVRSHTIEYLEPGLPGDEIVVRTWIAGLKRISSLRRYDIIRPRDGAALATAATNWAFINFQTRRLMRIPIEVSAAFEVVDSQSSPDDAERL